MGLAPSALAAEANETPSYMELLDYGYIQHPEHYVSGNRTEIVGYDDIVYFNLPYGMTVNHVDMLLYASDSIDTESISAGLEYWGHTYLYVDIISDNIIRVYGFIEEHTYEKIEFVFGSSSVGFINVYSCKVRFVTDSVATIDNIYVGGQGFSFTWDGYYEEVWFGDALYLEQFDFNLNWYDWQGYDTITFALNWRVSEFTSMYAIIEETPVPFTYSMVSNAADSGYYLLLVTIDLSGITRTDMGILEFKMTGKCMEEYQDYVEFLYCNGTANLRYPDPVLYWFQQLAKNQQDALAKIDAIGSVVDDIAVSVGNMIVYVNDIYNYLSNEINKSLFDIQLHLGNVESLISVWSERIRGTITDFWIDVGVWFNELQLTVVHWGQNILDALTPNTSKSDEMADEMASQATEMDELNQGLESMEKPDVDSIDTDISDIVSDGDITMVSGAFSVVLSDGIIGSMFVLSLLFMLASYVLFGKR